MLCITLFNVRVATLHVEDLFVPHIIIGDRFPYHLGFRHILEWDAQYNNLRVLTSKPVLFSGHVSLQCLSQSKF